MAEGAPTRRTVLERLASELGFPVPEITDAQRAAYRADMRAADDALDALIDRRTQRAA